MEKTTAEIVGLNVGNLRRAAGLLQEDLAQAMTDGFGMDWGSRQTVGEVEAGRRRLSLDEMVSLAAFFEVSPMALLIAPGGQAPAIDFDGAVQVRIGDRTLDWGSWVDWWQSAPLRAPTGRARQAIDTIVGKRGLQRPWATRARRGESLPAAYNAVRIERAERRSKEAPKTMPGPIVVTPGNDPVPITGPPFLPWAQSPDIGVTPGEPFTGRDDIERQVLLDAIERGAVTRITAKQKYEMTGRRRRSTPKKKRKDR